MIITKPKNTLSPEEVMASFAAEESTKSKIASDSVNYSILSNMAKELDEILSTATPQAIAEAAEEEDPDLYKDLRASLLKMVAFLEKNKVDVTTFHSSKSELSMKMDKMTLDEMRRNNDELMEEIAKQEEAQKAQQKKSLIGKIFMAIAVAVAVAVLTVLTAGAVGAVAGAAGAATAATAATAGATGAAAATATTAAVTTAAAATAGATAATAATTTAATTAVAAGVAAATSTYAIVSAGVAASMTLLTMMPVTKDGQSALTLATTELAEVLCASEVLTEEEAQLIANIIATVVMTALSFGAAYLAAPVSTLSSAVTTTATNASRATSNVAGEAIDMTAMNAGRVAVPQATAGSLGTRAVGSVVSVAADSAEEVIEQAIRMTSNDLARDYIKYITRTTLVNTASSTGLLSSAVDAMPDHWFKDEEQKEKAVMAVGIVEMALAGIYTGFSTYSMGKSVYNNTLKINNLADYNRAGSWASPERRATMHNVNAAVNIFNSFSGMLIGTLLAITSFNMMNYAKEIRELEAQTMMLNNAINMNSRTDRDDMNTQRSILDSQAAMTNAYRDLALSGSALAEAIKPKSRNK